MEGQVKCPETQLGHTIFLEKYQGPSIKRVSECWEYIFFFSFIPINGQLVTCIRLIYVKKGNQSLQPEHIKICKTAKFDNRKTYTDGYVIHALHG
jgi:hypothetical protein